MGILDFLLDDDGEIAETLRGLSDEDREDEYAKSEEYGEDYSPLKKDGNIWTKKIILVQKSIN